MKAPARLRINFVLERVDDPLLYDHLAQFRQRRRAEQLRSASVAHDGVVSRNSWLAAGKGVPDHGSRVAVQSPGAPEAAARTTQDAGIAHAAIDLFADPQAEP
jgi:hypothetical protein